MKTTEGHRRSTQSAGNRSSLTLIFAGAAVLAFLGLAVGNDLTRAPWWDEGLFADVALNFRNFGHFGSSLLTPTGFLRFPEVHRYTYWQFPFYMVAEGYWLRLVPTTIVWMRMLSTLFGLLYTAAWFVVVRALSQSSRLALFVTAVVALDYALISAASDARMDMMCAALGLCSLAVYSHLRERNWTAAVGVAAWFAAASLFCHPMGLIPNAVLTAFVLIEWRKFRLFGMIAILPYTLGIALCFRYISLAPTVFRAQSSAQSAMRSAGAAALLRNVLNDASTRYVGFYYASLAGSNKLKVFGLLFAIAGSVGLLLDRRTQYHLLRSMLLLWSVIAYIGVAAIDNQKLPMYFVYSMPFLVASAAVWVYEAWERHSKTRVLAGLLLCGSMASTLGGFVYKICKNDYQTVYMPAIRAIEDSLPHDGIVMGGSELAFALGFGPKLIDDRYLGYGSLVRPDIFVSNYYYGELLGSGLHDAWVWSRQTLQDEYHQIFQNSAYVVFLRNDVTPNGPPGKGTTVKTSSSATLP